MSALGTTGMKVAGRTDVGLIREHNEDNLIVVSIDRGGPEPLEGMRSIEMGERGAVLVVCDGMGGAAAGEVASQMAIEIVAECMLRAAPDPAPATGTTSSATSAASSHLDGAGSVNMTVTSPIASPHVRLARRLRNAALEANRRIFEASKADDARAGMGTTLTAVGVIDSQLVMVQVGDSRAYVLRGGVLVQVTRDQSLVNQLVETGQITEEQARDFEHSNVILQALGVQEEVEVLLSTVPLRRGDRVIVCTDGLTGVVSDEELAALLGSGNDMDEVCRLLIEMARGAGGPDNITLVAATFEDASLALPAPSDTITYQRWPLDEPPSESTAAVHHVERAWPESRRRGPDPARTFFSVMMLFAIVLCGLVVASQMRQQRGMVRCQVLGAPGLPIRVDGRDVGLRTHSGGTTVKLSPGHHRIGLRHTGAPAEERSVEIGAAALCQVRFDNAP